MVPFTEVHSNGGILEDVLSVGTLEQDVLSILLLSAKKTLYCSEHRGICIILDFQNYGFILRSTIQRDGLKI